MKQSPVAASTSNTYHQRVSVSVVATPRFEPIAVSALRINRAFGAEFANQKNIYCASMAGLGSQKLANPLKSVNFHRSLGSAKASRNMLNLHILFLSLGKARGGGVPPRA